MAEEMAQRAPLGQPREWGLPAAWRLALTVCPHCRGLGSGCLACEGSGDLFGVILLDAYRRGRDHVLARLREVEGARQIAAERVRAEEPSARQLKGALGL